MIFNTGIRCSILHLIVHIIVECTILLSYDISRKTISTISFTYIDIIIFVLIYSFCYVVEMENQIFLSILFITNFYTAEINYVEGFVKSRSQLFVSEVEWETHGVPNIIVFFYEYNILVWNKLFHKCKLSPSVRSINTFVIRSIISSVNRTTNGSGLTLAWKTKATIVSYFTSVCILLRKVCSHLSSQFCWIMKHTNQVAMCIIPIDCIIPSHTTKTTICRFRSVTKTIRT